MSQTGPELVLICHLGGVLCGFALATVVETMRPLPKEGLARAPDFVAGLSIIRGEPVPVVAGYSLVGGKVREPGRLVVLRCGSRRVAVAVDDVVGIAPIDPDRLKAMPPLASRAEDVVARVGARDGELLMILDAARIVPDDVLALFDAARLAS